MSAVLHTEAPAARKATRITSEAVRASSEKRSLTKPLVVTGIGPGEPITVTPAMYGQLDVDPSYQRGETSMVGEIVRALQAGGASLDPIKLCWRKDHPKTWWIVDGWQRACAHMQLNLPIHATLHHSDGPASEAQFFAVLNNRRAVQANVIVKGWPGPGAELLRQVNEDKGHPLFQRINFTQGSNDCRIAASTIVRAALCAVGVSKSPGRIHALLSRLDTAMASTRTAAKVKGFLELIGRAYPKGTPPAILMRAIGIVCNERWGAESVRGPSEKTIEKLRERQWKTVLLEQYMGVLVDEVKKVWRP